MQKFSKVIGTVISHVFSELFRNFISEGTAEGQAEEHQNFSKVSPEVIFTEYFLQ